MEFADRSCCVVTVSEQCFSAQQKPISCSGVILNAQTGTVICNGLLFSRFMNDNNKQSLSADHRYILPQMFSDKLDINIHFSEVPRDLDTNQCACAVSQSNNTTHHHHHHQHHQTPAQLLLLVNCLEFQEAFAKLFQESDKWSFYGGEEDDQDLLRDAQFLSWFAVLQVPGLTASNLGDTVPWADGSSLRKGCPVFACGSPFGALCPDLFMGTLSKGIVSNLAGEDNAIILTDARCLPGTEGGGLFLRDEGERAALVGLVVAPLCWKANEWIGLTLVASLQTVLRNITRCLGDRDPLRDVHLLRRGSTDLRLSATGIAPAPAAVMETYPTVALVDSGRFWGSGVVVGPRLVLTCRHVVCGKASVALMFYHKDRFHHVVGDVLFSTKASSPYDVAVVQLRDAPPEAAVPRLAQTFQPGDDVLVVGYGGLGRSCGPSVTSGVLSNAISLDGRTVMLQTTCAVQAGASGGAVVHAHSGELLGIVSSNTRDFAAKVTYPHLNFSLPATVLQPVLRRFHQTGDVGAFGALDASQEGLRRVWRLQSTPSKL